MIDGRRLLEPAGGMQPDRDGHGVFCLRTVDRERGADRCIADFRRHVREFPLDDVKRVRFPDEALEGRGEGWLRSGSEPERGYVRL